MSIWSKFQLGDQVFILFLLPPCFLANEVNFIETDKFSYVGQLYLGWAIYHEYQASGLIRDEKQVMLMQDNLNFELHFITNLILMEMGLIYESNFVFSCFLAISYLSYLSAIF